MEFAVRSDLVEATRSTEDGVPAYGLRFYVVAEDAEGRRWAHSWAALNGEVYRHPDGFNGFTEDNGKAERQAEALCARITKAYDEGRQLDPAHWTEIDPAYGSAAFQVLDAGHYFRDREIMEGHDAGEISAEEASRRMML